MTRSTAAALFACLLCATTMVTEVEGIVEKLTLAVSRVNVLRGFRSSQPKSVLALNDNTTYIEVSPGGTYDYTLTNYDFFYREDQSKVKAITIHTATDNQYSAGGPWEFHSQSLDYNDNVKAFFTSKGRLRIRMQGVNDEHVMRVYYLSVDLYIDNPDVTLAPTPLPTASPVTALPTTSPVTALPTTAPVTASPTLRPTTVPPVTSSPTGAPMVGPTTYRPTSRPTTAPSPEPTGDPTTAPTPGPTAEPTRKPTPGPTSEPTFPPTPEPTTLAPIMTPRPTPEPTNDPTSAPVTSAPTASPVTSAPTAGPTPSPTFGPTFAPTNKPTSQPTTSPTPRPVLGPTNPMITAESWWQPLSSQSLTWQSQKTGALDTAVVADVFDVDLFSTEAAEISTLRGLGRKVMCRFSFGTYEPYRDDWATFFPGGEATIPLAGQLWDWDVRWLDLRSYVTLKPIMSARIQLAKSKGCDGIHADYVDAYIHGDQTGVPITYQDQLDYNRWIAFECHYYDLGAGLKNDFEQADDLADDFDFAVTEMCFQYETCDKYDPFLARDKAVFGVEFVGEAADFCPMANAVGMSFMKKDADMTAVREGCEAFPLPPAVDDGVIWQPKASDNLTWQWQLLGTIDKSFDVDMYDVDVFDTPGYQIKTLRAQGKRVICYFSAGTYEGWRDDWAQYFPGGISTMPLGNDMSSWDEKWLDISQLEAIKPIMTGRLELAKAKGCDGVEPDNVDSHLQNPTETGLPLTYQHQLDYNIWLAEKAHEIGLSIALKNDQDQMAELVDYFDFAINEECFEWNECELYSMFTDKDKAVFGTEYKGDPAVFCVQAKAMKMSFIMKTLLLDTWRLGCEDIV